MPILKQISIVGTHMHVPTGCEYDYEVECRIAIDVRGRESLHLRVQVARGNASTGLVVTGQVDPGESFIGREVQLAIDCVELTCARISSLYRGASDACSRGSQRGSDNARHRRHQSVQPHDMRRPDERCGNKTGHAARCNPGEGRAQ